MAVDPHRPPQPDPALPKNTIVVMPKTPPMNRSALWVVFWGVGLAMGLLLRSVIEGPAPAQVDASTAPASGPAPTLEINVRAILELPTSTPTSPATGTLEVTTLTPTINDCGTAEPGTVCRVPLPPRPTATAYPSCETLDELTPGAWCMWPTAPRDPSAST